MVRTTVASVSPLLPAVGSFWVNDNSILPEASVFWVLEDSFLLPVAPCLAALVTTCWIPSDTSSLATGLLSSSATWMVTLTVRPNFILV